MLNESSNDIRPLSLIRHPEKSNFSTDEGLRESERTHANADAPSSPMLFLEKKRDFSLQIGSISQIVIKPLRLT